MSTTNPARPAPEHYMKAARQLRSEIITRGLSLGLERVSSGVRRVAQRLWERAAPPGRSAGTGRDLHHAG